MTAKRSPGVYVEEIPTLPPSVAEVSTAVPAFIGYTEKGGEAPTVARINTLLEYEELFGKAEPTEFKVTTTTVDGVEVLKDPADVEIKKTNEGEEPRLFLLHYCLSHYFKNGGGSCYVVSIGKYGDSNPKKADFVDGLKRLEKEDEPTLILLTDAVNLKDKDKVGKEAWADYLEVCQDALDQCNKLRDRFAILDVQKEGDASADDPGAFRELGSEYLMYGAAYYPYLTTTLSFRYEEDGVQINDEGENKTLETLKTSNTTLYNQIKAAIATKRVVLPPSAAVAGIYARVDRDRGVWKAPANVSVSAVIGPEKKITQMEQDELNIDPTAGKSINAIRAFTGKGTLVWGARTLAGNDNEWRYVSVRRLFIMIEESIQKSTGFAVFEANDATTWLKVKGMIESYLYGLWGRGALAGPTPESAYFVSVGLGKTMTQQDILEGRMIVEVGIAAVRPAEFIILRFTHKMQEA